MDLTRLSSLDRIVGGAALFLVVDLLFLPWIDVSYTLAAGIPAYAVTSSGAGAPDSFLGLLAVLLGLAVLVDLGLQRLTQVELPELPWSRDLLRAAGAGAALLLVALKFLLHADPSYLGFGCWLALALGLVLTGATYLGLKQQPSAAGS